MSTRIAIVDDVMEWTESAESEPEVDADYEAWQSARESMEGEL